MLDLNGKICTYKGAVQTFECDSNRHMNVMYYINKFELGGRNMSMELGLNKSFLEPAHLGIAVVEQQILYKREVFEDDIIHVYSHPLEYSNKVFSVFHEMYNIEHNQLSATMLAKLVIFNMETRKAIPIPDQIRNRIEELKM